MDENKSIMELTDEELEKVAGGEEGFPKDVQLTNKFVSVYGPYKYGNIGRNNLVMFDKTGDTLTWDDTVTLTGKTTERSVIGFRNLRTRKFYEISSPCHGWIYERDLFE